MSSVRYDGEQDQGGEDGQQGTEDFAWCVPGQ
jgi:hypothetical protein